MLLLITCLALSLSRSLSVWGFLNCARAGSGSETLSLCLVGCCGLRCEHGTARHLPLQAYKPAVFHHSSLCSEKAAI